MGYGFRLAKVLACEREYQKEYPNMAPAETFVAFIRIMTPSAFL
jgi:hypothetical protein